MIAKLAIASVLAASSVSGSAQEAMRSADGAKAVWPHMHQCTLEAVSNFTVTNTGGVSTGRVPVAGEITVTRIDLQVSGSPGGSPTITAHAINTKSTGANSGRASGEVKNQLPIGLDCVKSVVTGDEAAQKASLASFTFMSASGRSLGWSCSLSGSEEKPQFVVGLLVPTILGQAERSAAPGSAVRSEWSWGMSNSSGRMSIVPRAVEDNGGWHVACASKVPRQMNYDLVMSKKL